MNKYCTCGFPPGLHTEWMNLYGETWIIHVWWMKLEGHVGAEVPTDDLREWGYMHKEEE